MLRRFFSVLLIFLITLHFIAPSFVFAARTYSRRSTTPLRTSSVRSKVDLLFPNGGEHLEAGKTYDIKWRQQAASVIDSVSLHYVNSREAKEYVIVEKFYFNEKNIEERFIWNIPSIIGERYDSYKVVIRGYKGNVLIAEDRSEKYFSITPQDKKVPSPPTHELSREHLKLSVAVPNGGQIYKIGDTITVSWEQEQLTKIHIGLKTSDNSDVEWLRRNILVHPNDQVGSYSWSLSSDRDFREVFYKIHLEGERDNFGSRKAISDDYFMITKTGDGNLSITVPPLFERAARGETVLVKWNAPNAQRVLMSYSPYPYTQFSTFTAIAHVEDGSSSYNWKVSDIPDGYYALKLEGLIHDKVISEKVHDAYIWIGDQNSNYAGKKLVENPFTLLVELTSEAVTNTSHKIYWQKQGSIEGRNMTLEYGLTQKYGESVPVPTQEYSYGSIFLEDLTPGEVYHYRMNQGDKVTDDHTFGLAGGIIRAGYLIRNATDELVTVRLVWETKKESVDVYYCPDTHKSGCTGEFLINTAQSSIDVTKPIALWKTGTFLIVPHRYLGLEHTIGATVVVRNTGQFTFEKNEVSEDFIVQSNEWFHRVKGKILLKAQDRGKAFYVNPKTKKAFFLGGPKQAFVLLRENAIGISNENLEKFPVGFGFPEFQDSDGDGIEDFIEEKIGTNKYDKDTDGDGYTDKREIEHHYSPLNPLPIKQQVDMRFVEANKGKIFLQVEERGEAWYINPKDGKRYFLGDPSAAFSVMRRLSTGITNKDFESLK